MTVNISFSIPLFKLVELEEQGHLDHYVTAVAHRQLYDAVRGKVAATPEQYIEGLKDQRAKRYAATVHVYDDATYRDMTERLRHVINGEDTVTQARIILKLLES